MERNYGHKRARRGVVDRLWRWAAASLAAERSRWLLWLPVAFGGGIATYFALWSEPPVWIAPLVLVLALAGVWWGRNRAPALLGAALVAAFASGAVVAQWRTHAVAAPVIAKRIFVDDLRGRVVQVERRADGVRLTLDRLTVSGLGAAGTPDRVRVKHSVKHTVLPQPGDRVRTRAVLLPPPEPSTPGAYDFQRRAWFERLGGVGYTVAQVSAMESSRQGGATLWLARLREATSLRIQSALPGRAGAVAAALLTGDRSGIGEADLEAMRKSGLAHLLAISGLHIGLAAGFIFFVMRLGFALVPALVLRYPIRKWAAAGALAGAFAYMLITGATVPTQRAFIMVGLVLFAILIDRTALTMRLVAWAAAVILAIAPESLLGASFQMSFAAVVSLIAAYEALAAWRASRADGFSRRTPVTRAARYIGGIALTTLIAGTATGIFAIYHFNRFAAFGLAANLLSVPITALWIMPCGLIAFLLMPFGLDHIPLAAMGWGIEAVLGVAHTVANWKGAVWLAPAMPSWGLAAAALGGLWLCVWRTKWRLAGLAGPVAALLSLAFVTPPDVLITGDARLMAVRGADGRYMLSNQRAGAFVAGGWMRRAGTDTARAWPPNGASYDGRLRCDAAGCIYRLEGQAVALVRDERVLEEDCARADAVVSLEPVRTACRGPSHVIDRFDLWREGGHALWISARGIAVRSVADERGLRPWVLNRDRLGRQN